MQALLQLKTLPYCLPLPLESVSVCVSVLVSSASILYLYSSGSSTSQCQIVSSPFVESDQSLVLGKEMHNSDRL